MTDRMTASDADHAASPEEREDVLALVRSWLDDWSDTLTRDDASEYLGDFVENVNELLLRMMILMNNYTTTIH